MPKKSKTTDSEAGKPVSGSNVVGTGNEARLKLYGDIADNSEAIRAEEMSEPEEEDADETETDETPSPDQPHERSEPADDDDPETGQVDEAQQPAPQAKKFKLKINGQEREATEEEVLALAQKVGSADQYLAEAAKLYQQSRQPQQLSQADAEAKSEEDDLALARALQMGSEEEAAKVIRRLRSGPSVKADDLSRLVDERLTFQEAVKKAQDEFKDLFEVPLLAQAFMVEDQRLLREGDSRSYAERYRAIGNDLRQQIGKVKGPQTRLEKETRKASVTPIRPANARAQAAPDEEPDDSPQTVIEQMAKSRGQRST